MYAPFVFVSVGPALVRAVFPAAQNATPSGVTIVASEAYNQGDEARSTPGADRAGGRRGRRPGGHLRPLGSSGGEAEADLVRHLRPAARLREGAGEAVRRPVRLRHDRPPAADRGAATRRPRRDAGGTRPGRRFLRHECAGGRCRRAGPRQDGREHGLRRREREAARGRRRRCEAAAARLARARAGAEPRAAPARRPAARPLARRLLDRAAARARRPHRPLPAVQLRPR